MEAGSRQILPAIERSSKGTRTVARQIGARMASSGRAEDARRPVRRAVLRSSSVVDATIGVHAGASTARRGARTRQCGWSDTQHRQQPLLRSDEPDGVCLHEIVAGPRVGCIEYAIPKCIAIHDGMRELAIPCVNAARRRRNRFFGARGSEYSRRPVGIGVCTHGACRGIQTPVDPVLQFRGSMFIRSR